MRLLGLGGSLAVMLAGTFVTGGCGECNHRMADSDDIKATWALSPDTLQGEGMAVPVVVESVRLRVGYDATFNRKGHPNSRATTSVDCGSGASTCHISYTFGSRSGATTDNEKLLVKFTNAQGSQTLTLAHPGSGATGIVSLPGCGTVAVEVTADAGDDASGIASNFEFALDRAGCENCPRATQ